MLPSTYTINIFSVFSEEEPDLNSELEISVRRHKAAYLNI